MNLKIQTIVDKEIMKKTKLLMISDHALTHSGVAIQSKYLIEGLLDLNKYEIIQLGAAKYHEDMRPKKVNKDFTIIPSIGFGDKEIIRSLLASEKPDAMIIFTDARFFDHVFEMEDEIHEVCPIMWWHVWDNKPVPTFNSYAYNSVDAINCISKLTYDLCKELCPEKTSYIPHAIKRKDYFRLESKLIEKYKKAILGEKSDWFVGAWVNRNIRRKRPADVLKSWSIFLEKQYKEFGHKKSLLIMHTDPKDPAGINLLEVAKMLNLEENVRFSSEILNDEALNLLYNISDFTLNIAFSEGFGLSTLESLYTSTPIITSVTGGLQSQVINFKTEELHGIAIYPQMTTISGTQEIPYLNEDYVTVESVAKAILEFYRKPAKDRKLLGEKGQKYVLENFNIKKMIEDWDISIEKTCKTWNQKSNKVRLEEL